MLIGVAAVVVTAMIVSALVPLWSILFTKRSLTTTFGAPSRLAAPPTVAAVATEVSRALREPAKKNSSHQL